MSILGVDLGGTKLSLALFSRAGSMLRRSATALQNRTGSDAGKLITDEITKIVNEKAEGPVEAIGIAVPGISRQKTGTVWAPNIEGWEDYPLLNDVQHIAHDIPVTIESDRACYIAGERWQGNAKDCNDAIYLAVGTGIGAGILVNGNILRGAHDIAGAIGWMALDRPFQEKYISCGCFEYHASGEGIAKVAGEFLSSNESYTGILRHHPAENITAHTVFDAYEDNDEIAVAVIEQCIQFWGMTVANLVSLFNPEKIIFGGGVFGPAIRFIPAIKAEAAKWAQPISMQKVEIESSQLGTDAGLYGAAYLALQKFGSDDV